MDFSITRNGEKIIITDEEFNNLLITKEFNEFMKTFPSIESMALYLYLVADTEEIDKGLLKQAIEIAGEDEEIPKKDVKKKGNAFDNIDFNALEAEEE